ncbi:predicted protein [Plenodomus lingam JN3]|uniref:Predicted protein n=1 Tax=Leptosphaeria maculans (strain JN3 / isolate v23.1.3 / race Av1-4-5-6-7-8) TaxID=985895 RepID=E5AAF6_LEPMJ|nr:predicted protein [Plenodomus lingam JN3]CBY00647.1 predicted protein [Plenodomus lingam JN3]
MELLRHGAKIPDESTTQGWPRQRRKHFYCALEILKGHKALTRKTRQMYVCGHHVCRLAFIEMSFRYFMQLESMGKHCAGHELKRCDSDRSKRVRRDDYYDGSLGEFSQLAGFFLTSGFSSLNDVWPTQQLLIIFESITFAV